MAAALDTVLRRGVGALNGLALLSLVVLALVTVADIVGRYMFNRPLLGTLELSEMLMVFLVFGGLAFTELQNGHVEVDLLVRRLPARGQALCETAAALLSAGFWGGVAWRTALRATDVHAAGETTSNLLLPVAPFMWAAAAGSGVFAVALLARTLRALRRVVAP